MKSENSPLIQTVLPIILAGGSGTRLWPLSRALYPKQYLAFGSSQQTLFQLAVQRISGPSLKSSNVSWQMLPPCVVANEEHRFMALEQLRELGIENARIILEPTGRNTAPALMLGALLARDEMAAVGDPILVVAPADQVITNVAAFSNVLHQAMHAATDGSVVVLGIPPKNPETGYGYIHAISEESGQDAPKSVRAFVEKPDVETATQYLAQGDYYWNSGMFIMRASVWIKLLAEFRSDIANLVERAWQSRSQDNGFVRPDRTEFFNIPAESIDYAVMEKCSTSLAHFGTPTKMLPLDAGWSDLGAWEAVWQTSAKDKQNNVVRGDVLMEDCSDNLIYAQTKLVVAIGLKDIVVVETPDAVLIAHKGNSQQVKNVVARLEKNKRDEIIKHRRVHRPWGWYDATDAGYRFQVKRIMVKPGASLSLQKHHHRAEHWIVVSGTAEVLCGETKLFLTENQSTYIPLGQTHRLSNPGMIPLEIIEVQSGAYLGEDDIVRLDDAYGRIATHNDSQKK